MGWITQWFCLTLARSPETCLGDYRGILARRESQSMLNRPHKWGRDQIRSFLSSMKSHRFEKVIYKKASNDWIALPTSNAVWPQKTRRKCKWQKKCTLSARIVLKTNYLNCTKLREQKMFAVNANFLYASMRTKERRSLDINICTKLRVPQASLALQSMKGCHFAMPFL